MKRSVRRLEIVRDKDKKVSTPDPSLCIWKLPSHLPTLANELKMMIFSQLDTKDLLLGVAKTCKSLSKIAYPLGYEKVDLLLHPSNCLLYGDLNWAKHRGIGFIRHLQIQGSAPVNEALEEGEDVVLRGFLTALPRDGLLSFRFTSLTPGSRKISLLTFVTLLKTQNQLRELELPIITKETQTFAIDDMMDPLQLPHLRTLTLAPCSWGSKAFPKMWEAMLTRASHMVGVHLVYAKSDRHEVSRPMRPYGPGFPTLSSLMTKMTIRGHRFEVHWMTLKDTAFPAVRALQILECTSIDHVALYFGPESFPALNALMLRNNRSSSGEAVFALLSKMKNLREIFVEQDDLSHQGTLDLTSHKNSVELLVICSPLDKWPRSHSQRGFGKAIDTCRALRFLGMSLDRTDLDRKSFDRINLCGLNIDGINLAPPLQLLFVRQAIHLKKGWTSKSHAAVQYLTHDRLEDYVGRQILDRATSNEGSKCTGSGYFALAHRIESGEEEIRNTGLERDNASLRTRTKKIFTFGSTVSFAPYSGLAKKILEENASHEYFFLEEFMDSMMEQSTVSIGKWF